MWPRSPTWASPVATDCPAWAPPLLAIQFLTRVPVPAVSRLSESAVRVGLGRAIAWFPLVGALVGVVTAGTLLLAEQVWPRLVAVLLALIVEARITGAFHEDAVADFCDGVGGGKDPAHVRQIMKDSRIGSFGALGLMLSLALRAALIYSLDATRPAGNGAVGNALGLDTVHSLAVGSAGVAFAIIAAATFGRLLAVIAMATTAPAPTAGGLAKDVTASIRARDVLLAVLISLPGLLPFALGAPLALLSACAAGLAFLIWFRALVIRRVGGSTGDCLGFAAYAGQLIVLMAATALQAVG
jgi:adenosylcobinamide-GDP ribazoletransferase